jgi:polyphosphate glucokinase
MNVLVIDVGGTHVKVLATDQSEVVKIVSGPDMTAHRMVSAVRKAVAGWDYSAVTIGYPGPVQRGRPAREPFNLGRGWVRFDFTSAFGCPVRIINDAAMQALGSYQGGKMLFLGLGTGLGSALITEGVVVPMELAHLPFRRGRSYEEYLGVAGLERLGKRRWRRYVEQVVALLSAALGCDYVVLGGGNAKYLKKLPKIARLGDNANAFQGGFRIWQDDLNAATTSHQPIVAKVATIPERRTTPSRRRRSSEPGK